MEWTLPAANDRWALFLDFDGTLVEIASAPDAVRVDPELPGLLEQLCSRFGGSLAMVSGRPISDLDSFLAPHRFAAAGSHGAERRDARGELHRMGLVPEELQPARAELAGLTARHPALLLEDKGTSLALHFRQAPQLEGLARDAMQRVLTRLPPEAHLQDGHCVIELKGRSVNKRVAIERFMAEPPFAGRVPVFVGDDVADYEGLVFVQSIGGQALFVGPEPQPGLGWLPHPAAVRAWLRGLTR